MSTKRTTKKTSTSSASKPKRTTKKTATKSATKPKKTTTKKTSKRTTKPQASKETKPSTSSADTTATRCRKCGSTERESYQQKHEIPAAGQLAPDGKPASHIKLQWTKCKSCGQSRVDRTYLNRT